tara:strand:- start:581 stop:1366 length:786 start_codon:yes stop_codon:yes gene_type:complete
MKKYLVIGNPIEHSLSPKLHNYWFKINNIEANYDKKLIEEDQVESVIKDIRKGNISGINITVPHKQTILKFCDELTPVVKKIKSVNTIYKINNKVIGDNTDVGGFEESLKHIKYSLKGKKIFLLGAGGVAPSLIYSLQKLGALEITISNRTVEKAENLKNIFTELRVIKWGETVDFDMIINATSLGLKNNDIIDLEYNKIRSKFFFDVIYNPVKTNFLKEAEKSGNKIENGKLMFIYQAQLAFQLWHGLKPKIDNNVLSLI